MLSWSNDNKNRVVSVWCHDSCVILAIVLYYNFQPLREFKCLKRCSRPTFFKLYVLLLAFWTRSNPKLNRVHWTWFIRSTKYVISKKSQCYVYFHYQMYRLIYWPECFLSTGHLEYFIQQSKIFLLENEQIRIWKARYQATASNKDDALKITFHGGYSLRVERHLSHYLYAQCN